MRSRIQIGVLRMAIKAAPILPNPCHLSRPPRVALGGTGRLTPAQDHGTLTMWPQGAARLAHNGATGKDTRSMMRKALPLIASLAVLALAAGTLRGEWSLLTRARDAVFDLYQRVEPRGITDSPVVIADIDEESLRKLGQWPWPRDYLAFLLQRLHQAGAVAVGFDILFAEPDRASPARIAERLPPDSPAREALVALGDTDETFARALGLIPTVMATAPIRRTAEGTDQPPPNAPGLSFAGPDPSRHMPVMPRRIASLPALEAAAAGVGAISYRDEGDGILRKVPTVVLQDGRPIPLLAIDLLRVVQRAPGLIVKSVGASGESAGGAASTGVTAVKVGQFVVPTDASGEMRIHFARFDPSRYHPIWQLLDGTRALPDLTGKIVLVGASATALLDLRFSPVDGRIPGVEVHAQAIDQILEGKFLTRPDYAPGLELLFLTALGLVVIGLVHRSGALWSGVIGGTVLAVAIGGSFHAFSAHRMLFDPVAPSLGAIAVFLVASIGRHWQTEQQQRFIRNAFQSYVSPNLVTELIKHPDRLKLGGERRTCSFLFTDLAGFTAWVERSDPEEATDLLNEYLDRMIQIGFDHGGTLDKVVGDATVFYFNAPVDQPDHAARAYRCALAMDAFAHAYAAAKRADGIPLGETRIGVNTGPVTVGNFGGKIFDYTAHGDAINTAARLESVNKHLGTRLCIAKATTEAVPDFFGRPAGELVLKGKRESTPVFEPLTLEAHASPPVQAYLAAYRLLEAGEAGARAAFEAVLAQAPDDPLAALHRDRLAAGEHGTRIVMTEK